MSVDEQRRRMLRRLPRVLQEGPRINALLSALAEENAELVEATRLLLRSRWLKTAAVWPGNYGSFEKPEPELEEGERRPRVQPVTDELARLTELLGLRPDPGESARQFRARARAYMQIHREGLGTAKAILGLAALEYRATWPPEIEFESPPDLDGDDFIEAVAVARLSIPVGPRKHHRRRIEIRVIDHPFRRRLRKHSDVTVGSEVLVTVSGRTQASPSLRLQAPADADLHFPSLSHRNHRTRLVYAGIVPAGGELLIRDGHGALLQMPGGAPVVAAPLLMTREGDRGLAGEALAFNSQSARFAGPEGGARFASAVRSDTVPGLVLGDNRYKLASHSRQEVVGLHLAGDDSWSPAEVSTPGLGAPARRLAFELTYRERRSASFTLQIPNFVPPRFGTSFSELSSALQRAVNYGRAAGLRGRIELRIQLPREQSPVREYIAGRLKLKLDETVKVREDQSARLKLKLDESVPSPRERVGQLGIFNEHRFDSSVFTDIEVREAKFDASYFDHATLIHREQGRFGSSPEEPNAAHFNRATFSARGHAGTLNHPNSRFGEAVFH